MNIPSLIYFLLLSSLFLNQDDKNITNPIKYFLVRYSDTTNMSEFQERHLLKIVSDFNNDGSKDIMLTDPFTGGAHNLEWEIFLQTHDGTYSSVGIITFGSAESVKPISRGVSFFMCGEHYSGEESFTSIYSISFNGIKKIKEISSKDSSMQNYINSFPATILVDSCCTVHELLKNINSHWSVGCN